MDDVVGTCGGLPVSPEAVPLARWAATARQSRRRDVSLNVPPHAQVELAALFLVAKKKLSNEAKKDSILCKKTWGIQP